MYGKSDQIRDSPDRNRVGCVLAIPINRNYALYFILCVSHLKVKQSHMMRNEWVGGFCLPHPLSAN